MNHYRISDERVAWRVVEGEAVLVHADTSAYYGLNRSATEVWLVLADGAGSRRRVLERLASRFGVPAEEVAADVDEFLAALLADDLLTRVSGTSNGPALQPHEPGSADALPDYEPPRIERFGELETLILSGE